MKLITKVTGMSAVFLFALIASGIGQADEHEVEDLDKKFIRYMVKVDAKWPSGPLLVKKIGKCKKHNHDGCLLFEKDYEGSITFYLSSSTHRKTCENSANEVITKVELATMSKAQNPNKGEFSGNLESWIKNYAFNTINLNTGVVFEAPWEMASTHVTLRNQNSQPSSMGEKQFWYRVTVTSCSDPSSTLTTDPRGDNEGKH